MTARSMHDGGVTVHDGPTTNQPGATTASAPSSRHWSQRPLRVVPALLGINILVFLAWQVAAPGSALWILLARNFLVSTTRLDAGMWWTVFTAAFSHMELWHLALNMVVLWSFGSVLERLWGVRVFIAFYLAAIVVSSLSHCLLSSLLMGDDRIAALGASGAVTGLLMAFALQFPRHRILLFAIIPIPALVGVLGFVALDVWGLVAQSRGGGMRIGHGAHLGGALAGAVFYLTYLRHRFPKMPPPAPPRQGHPTIELTAEEAAEFDRLRAKLAQEGPSALTPKEQDFLRRLRARALGDG